MTAFPTSPNEQALLRVGVEFPDAGVTRRTTGSEIARGTLRYARRATHSLGAKTWGAKAGRRVAKSHEER